MTDAQPAPLQPPAAAEASLVAVESITRARGQRTEFPEDLLSFEFEAKEISRLAEAMLKDAELRLRTQDKHVKGCRDSGIAQRVEFAEAARVAALATLNPAKDKLAVPLLQLAAARDPSEKVRKAAKDALGKPPL